MFLPERWRAWLLEQLREEFSAFDQEQHEIDRLNRKMSEAARALDRVAKHLKLRAERDRLALKMREFDATPESVREGWKARQVADAIRGSWDLAKAVAFTDKPLPVAAERKAQLRSRLPRKRYETAFAALSPVQDWLATEPSSKSIYAYSDWARAENANLPPGETPIPLAHAIASRWGLSWPEIVQFVEEGQAPEQSPRKPRVAKKRERGSAGKHYLLDSQLRSRLIRSAREARGWSIRELARRSGLDPSSLAKLERDERSNPSFETIVKLAITLDLALDDFATAD